MALEIIVRDDDRGWTQSTRDVDQSRSLISNAISIAGITPSDIRFIETPRGYADVSDHGNLMKSMLSWYQDLLEDTGEDDIISMDAEPWSLYFSIEATAVLLGEIPKELLILQKHLKDHIQVKPL